MIGASSLTVREQALMTRVFRAHPEVEGVKLFGSRAKGTQTPHSDVDLALLGAGDSLQAEAIAAELDELPLPYHYAVKAFAEITFRELREQFDRVGISIYTADA